MIDIAINPRIDLGPVALTWHAIFGIAGMASGSAVGMALARGRLPLKDAYAVALLGCLGGLLGSRVLHVIEAWPDYAAAPYNAILIWQGGASIMGGILGGMTFAVLAMRSLRVPLGVGFDIGAVALPVGMAVGRVGDLINGEHHSVACVALPWCVRYSHPASPGQRSLVHPAVGYELVLDLLIAALCLALWRHGALPGRLIFVFGLAYSGGRFMLDFLRLDRPVALGLDQAQVLALAIGIVSIVALHPTAGARLISLGRSEHRRSRN